MFTLQYLALSRPSPTAVEPPSTFWSKDARMRWARVPVEETPRQGHVQSRALTAAVKPGDVDSASLSRRTAGR